MLAQHMNSPLQLSPDLGRALPLSPLTTGGQGALIQTVIHGLGSLLTSVSELVLSCIDVSLKDYSEYFGMTAHHYLMLQRIFHQESQSMESN